MKSLCFMCGIAQVLCVIDTGGRMVEAYVDLWIFQRFSSCSKAPMLKPIHLQLLVVIICLFACRMQNKGSYAIKDFSERVQPTLVKLVTEGFVIYEDSALHLATNSELLQLMQCEHPILRAMAYRAIGKRKAMDQFEVLMNHLHDTALVATDQGEFGIRFRRVSDDLLQETVWKTQEAKDKTVERVLTKHNYLRSAYEILYTLAPQEKYYSIIRNMATRPRRLTEDGHELDFDDIEYALYGLAKFKKPEDRQIIRKLLREHMSELSFVSLQLLQDFPDKEYSEIFQQYHRRKFYRFSGHSRNGFSASYIDRADPRDFINALVAQQTGWSAAILDTMLRLLPSMACMPGKDQVRDDVVIAIWESSSPVYAALRKKIKRRAEEIEAGILRVEVDSSYLQKDTTASPILWNE